MWIGNQRIGSEALTITHAEVTSIKEDGEGSSKEEKSKAKVGERPKSFFNPILSFFEVLKVKYQSQRLNKMLKLQQFQLKDKETYEDAYH